MVNKRIPIRRMGFQTIVSTQCGPGADTGADHLASAGQWLSNAGERDTARNGSANDRVTAIAVGFGKNQGALRWVEHYVIILIGTHVNKH